MPLKDGGGENEREKQALGELELLNRSMIDTATQIVSDNEPASNLWPQFRQAHADYKRRRDDLLKPEEPIIIQSDHEPKAEPQRHYNFKHKIPVEDIYIQWPLSSSLQDSLQITAPTPGDVIQNEHASKLRSILRNLLTQGELLYHYAARAVVRILPDTVVKINKSKLSGRSTCPFTHPQTLAPNSSAAVTWRNSD